ncbi:RNA polymerase sigma factor [Mucilaginibacter dorajii]|uniref:RNA polymerase sigma factor n=1 Tax=Mucilaginibacter dorajii TaxID=692994 RepID=UPI00216A14A5|nr:hypothetical protein [Mucilaginibacter dorajii]MCS3732364.1 hypothetical protein [Mucilaginibacter dorajii]
MKNAANDSELWKLFREGDSLAYTKLVDAYSGVLFDYGYRIVPDKDLIKDFLQDVLWNCGKGVSGSMIPLLLKTTCLKP